LLYAIALAFRSLIEVGKGSFFLNSAALLLCAVGFVYFTVRIVHWSWETPVPFARSEEAYK